MFCPNCKKEVNETDKLCSYCGYLLDISGGEAIKKFSNESYGSFNIEQEKAEEIFFDWMKKNNLVKKTETKNDFLIHLEKVYLPVYHVSGNGDMNFTYREKSIITNSNGVKETVFSKEKKKVFNAIVDTLELANKSFEDFYFKHLLPFDFLTYTSYKNDSVKKEDINIEKNSAIKKIKETVIKDYKNKFVKDNINVDIFRDDFSLSVTDIYFLPVYKGRYDYKNKDFFFCINGESGKISGKYPLNKKKIASILLFIILFVGISLYIIYKLI